MIQALLLIVFVAGGLSLLGLWTRDFADLLWMFVARKLLTGLTTVAVLIVMLGVVAGTTGLPPISATAFCVAVLVTPTLAKRSANLVARWKAGGRSSGDVAEPQKAVPLSGFVFAQERAAQSEAYEAPRVAQ
jgi:hypothetical protein